MLAEGLRSAFENACRVSHWERDREMELFAPGFHDLKIFDHHFISGVTSRYHRAEFSDEIRGGGGLLFWGGHFVVLVRIPLLLLFFFFF